MSNELNLSNDPYIIVSSDSHAGLQCEEYRPYLESSVHEEFDEYVAERHENRRLTEEINGEYVAEWEGKNAEGLKGAYDPDIRDKELDADGISGEIIFADGDAVTGMESPPFGAGLAAGQITDPRLAYAGARAHNRWLEEFCSTSPERRAGVARVPITQGVDEAVKEVEALAERGLDPSLPVMKAIGVREILAMQAGEISRGRAIELASRDSRHYAKRQMTWIRNNYRAQISIDEKFSTRFVKEIFPILLK